jgi:hypothetical protein
MKCSQVSVAQISHRAKAFLAGNMMHATSVGFMAFVALMFVSKQ